MVTLGDGFTVGKVAMLTATQGEGEDPVTAEASYSDGAFTIPADENEFAVGVVSVRITDLTNPTKDGDTEVVTVQQGGFAAAPGMVNISEKPFDPEEVGFSSSVPSAAVQITLKGYAAADAAIEPNEDITVDLTGFGVPSSIADSAIDIASKGFSGTPSNVLVNGKKVTMTVPNLDGKGEEQEAPIVGNYTIKFKQSAGITNPASAGEKTIKWQENAPSGDENEAKDSIDRVVELSTKAGTRGTASTASFKGFADGTATVDLNKTKLTEVTIADNVGTLELDTSSASFKSNQDNVITATDAAGTAQDVSATFTISPKLVLDPEETSVSKSVTLKLSDWPINTAITAVTIGASTTAPATSQSTNGEGKAEFSVQVPSTVNRGTQTVKVTGGKGDDASSATASLRVGVLELTVQPATAVPGQEITIQGSGFVADDKIDSVTIGNQTVKLSADQGKASSSGNIVVSIKVPSTGTAIGDGEKSIEVKTTAAGSGREGEGSVTIPKATISLSPGEARRGEAITATGSGFPVGDLIQIKYENKETGDLVTATAKASDSAGALDATFPVPSFAQIGQEHNVEAVSVGVYEAVTAKTTHSTPGAQLTLPKTASPGTAITISGMNFPAFATVAELKIGTIDIRPVPAPSTSIDGDFSTTILVPQMGLGNQTVTVKVSSTTITTFLELVTATIEAVTDPAEVFEPLGDRLVRVWYLDRETQTWSFYDPDPEIAALGLNMESVVSGQNVSIIISSGESIEFQGMTLYQGTNPIALK